MGIADGPPIGMEGAAPLPTRSGVWEESINCIISIDHVNRERTSSAFQKVMRQHFWCAVDKRVVANRVKFS